MADPIRTVGIATALYKPEVRESAILLCRALVAAGVRVLLNRSLGELPGVLPEGSVELVGPAELAQTDLVISLGGDGTLLAVACHAGPRGTPLLGVDLGSFGFLAAESFDVLLSRLDRVLAGDYATEARLMVAAQVVRGQHLVSEHYGLNEAVIAKTDVRRLVRLYTRVNGEHIATYPADGLIISTPTGSTAYTLSAGGPIVSPAVETLVIVPICPHTLYSRPLVVEPTAVIDVNATSRGEPALGVTLTLDGQEAIELDPGDSVVVRRAAFDARLVHVSSGGFYERLRTRLNWGAER